MFMHIGDTRIVFYDELIGIFNSKIKEKEENKFFLDKNLDDEEIKKIDSCKSFVVTEKKVFLSNLSSTTLAKR